ncbi:MAG TPA: hypothetical protein VM238_14720 [Phycisphaerae bacterium]|nr:hypothetical protein [Phycisphaerae bacterium]HUU92449.1 hypothetical protein [Phycisphaerae bacterium]
MKQRAIQAGLIVAIVAAALVLRQRGAPALPETPEAAVNALFDAAGKGDDEAYLALLRGELARTLRATRSQMGAEAFQANLRRSAGGIVGLAVTRRDDASPPDVALNVEIIFRDRNERQRLVVSPESGAWAVTALGPASTTQPAIPYGTPVYQE